VTGGPLQLVIFHDAVRQSANDHHARIGLSGRAWKNGGGTTREILRVPAEPTAFDWRLSLATIDSPGPFSAFEG